MRMELLLPHFQNYKMDSFELDRLLERATVGDINAINNLIDFYIEQKDFYHAKLEIERLKYINQPESYRRLGYIYSCGLIDKPDFDAAKLYYKKGFELGDEACGYNLALLDIKEGNYADAIPYLTYGVSVNHIPSIKLLAKLYIEGKVVSKDLEIAFSLLKKALDLGEVEVYASLGKVCYQLHNYDEAFNYFSQGFKHKDPDCIFYLGLCYASGLGVKQDLARARYYYEIGANINEPRCLYNLSLYYKDGIGVEKSEALASSLYQKAIENGFKK